MTRLNLEFDDDSEQAINLLMARLNAPDRVTLIQFALATLETLAREMERGGDIVLRYPDGTERKFVLALLCWL